jgi:hypothetical protein
VLSRNEKLGGGMGVVGFRHEGSQEVKYDYKYSDLHSISLAPFSQNRNKTTPRKNYSLSQILGFDLEILTLLHPFFTLYTFIYFLHFISFFLLLILISPSPSISLSILFYHHSLLLPVIIVIISVILFFKICCCKFLFIFIWIFMEFF